MRPFLKVEDNLAMQHLELVAHHKPCATIVLAEQPSPVERHAADELARIVKEITGAALPVVAEAKSGRTTLPSTEGRAVTGTSGASEASGDVPVTASPAILIGTPDTHAGIAKLVEAGKLKLSADDPGLDGYVMAALQDGKRTFVVLGGSQDRSALNAVYHFLEECAGCGWWFDGDTIPKNKTLAIPMMNDRIRPRFETRLGNGWFYDNDFWTFDDWKRYYDYLAKRRMNGVLYYSRYPYATMTLRRLGLDATLTPLEQSHAEVARRCMAYVRQELGFRVVLPAIYMNNWWRGTNPERFYQKHKDSVAWIKQEWGGFPYHVMSPKDPTFRRLNEALVRTCIEELGTDHLYLIDTTSEESTDLPLDKIPQNIADGVHESLEVARKVDPQARFLLSWWCLVASQIDKQRMAYAQGSLLALRNEPDTIGQEICTENTDHPHYYELFSDENGSYYGRPWHAGIFHGGGSSLRMSGDIPLLVRQFRELADDPKARNLHGVTLFPEHGHNHNFPYFDCAMQLAFDPKQVDMAVFAKSYVLRRYGPKGAPLAPVIDLLIETVYSTYNSSLFNRPFYYVWEGRLCWTPVEELNQRMIGYGPKLAQAIETMLENAPALEGAPHYKRDLIDLGTQYLGGRGTDYYWRMIAAYKAKDLAAFQRWAARAMEMMDYQAKLAGAWPGHRLATYEAQAMRWPTLDFGQDLFFGPMGGGPPQGFDNAMWERIYHTTLFYPINWMLDYAARDWPELILHVYKHELELRITTMQKELTEGQAVPRAAMEQKKTGYLMDIQSRSPFPDENAIYHKFIREGYPKMNYYDGPVPDLVRDILQRFPPNG